MAMIDGMLQELEQEAQTTRRVLERVPDDRLTWRPHERARTLGDPSPSSVAELIPALQQSVAKAKNVLGGMNDADLMATWRMMRGDRELFAVPRAAILRSVMLNHWYHHRGQLTVYLRQLGVPVPSIYGPSADENPFA